MSRTILEREDLLVPLAEVFRQHGYDGTSIGIITAATGAGRSSLYHFFPGGKQQMAEAVLDHISAWFEVEVFAPLDRLPPAEGIPAMLQAVRAYFQSGQRVCLVGAFALEQTRDLFAVRIGLYFTRWRDSLAACLTRGGLPDANARTEATRIIAAIQGGIVLARASGDPGDFDAALGAFSR